MDKQTKIALIKYLVENVDTISLLNEGPLLDKLENRGKSALKDLYDSRMKTVPEQNGRKNPFLYQYPVAFRDDTLRPMTGKMEPEWRRNPAKRYKTVMGAGRLFKDANPALAAEFKDEAKGFKAGADNLRKMSYYRTLAKSPKLRARLMRMVYGMGKRIK